MGRNRRGQQMIHPLHHPIIRLPIGSGRMVCIKYNQLPLTAQHSGHLPQQRHRLLHMTQNGVQYHHIKRPVGIGQISPVQVIPLHSTPSLQLPRPLQQTLAHIRAVQLGTRMQYLRRPTRDDPRATTQIQKANRLVPSHSRQIIPNHPRKDRMSTTLLQSRHHRFQGALSLRVRVVVRIHDVNGYRLPDRIQSSGSSPARIQSPPTNAQHHSGKFPSSAKSAICLVKPSINSCLSPSHKTGPPTNTSQKKGTRMASPRGNALPRPCKNTG